MVARTLTVTVFAAAGLLMVTSAEHAAGTDLRPERYDDLAGLAREQAGRVADLRAEVTRLNREVDALSKGAAGSALRTVRDRAPAERRAASLDPLIGPGLVVTLDDAPKDVLASAGDLVNQALVHQQDIQGVANALWAGGAEALTIRGVRVISTTGIKCVGNTVILNGVPYAPPYDIAAIGDPERLRQAVEDSPYVQAYLDRVDVWELGWQVEAQERLRAPAFSGLLDLRHAKVITP
ncbi:DUF881 domain-containing protein [Nocardioides marmoribigeumensis]